MFREQVTVFYLNPDASPQGQLVLFTPEQCGRYVIKAEICNRGTIGASQIVKSIEFQRLDREGW